MFDLLDRCYGGRHIGRSDSRGMYCWYWQCLSQILVWKLGGSILRKRALLFVGSSCLTMDIMRLLPGYTVTDKFGALVLLAVFCLMVLGVTELTVKKEIKE